MSRSNGCTCGCRAVSRGEFLLVVVLHGVRRDQHLGLRVVEQQAEEPEPVAERQGEIVGYMVTRVGQLGGLIGVEFGVRRFGNFRQRYGGGCIIGYIIFHNAAISVMIRCRSSGCHMPSTMAAASSDRADHESALWAFEGCRRS